MKYAVIIKHPYRDSDYRVDVVDVPDDTDKHDIYKVIMRNMLGPFDVVCITEKLSDRDISKHLERLQKENENHIET